MIFSIPGNLFNILDSPFPVLCGLNKDKQFVADNDLENRHNNCTFVMLDDDELEILNSDALLQLKEGPNTSSLKSLLSRVKPLFEKLQLSQLQKLDSSVMGKPDASGYSTNNYQSANSQRQPSMV